MTQEVCIIVAVSKNNVIGCNDELPWSLFSDMMHFKSTTANCPVIMGRKTYDSIVKKIGHPLLGRFNVVITRDKSKFSNDSKAVAFVESFEEALEVTHNMVAEKVFVIGGEQIYKIAEKFADRFYITNVDAEVDGDAFFSLDISQLHLISSKKHFASDINDFDFSINEYSRTAPEVIKTKTVILTINDEDCEDVDCLSESITEIVDTTFDDAPSYCECPTWVKDAFDTTFDTDI